MPTPRSPTTPIRVARRTKIVCTLGPASAEPRILERMIRAGMDVARLNFSHGDHASHARLLAALRRAAAAVGRPVGVLQDLCGPKIRLGTIPGDVVEVAAGEEIVLRAGAAARGGGGLAVQYAALARDVDRGDRLAFDDGALEARVVSVRGDAVRVRFVQGGRLRTGKGINLPGVTVSSPSVTPKDLADLEWGLAHRVDFVALSFVRRVEDLARVKRRLARAKRPPLLVAKIEKPEALEQLPEILRAVDGVMVARGDLGVEMAYEKVPLVQKRLIRLANELDIPVITATQMLESMTVNPRPTRAEASDVANAILDGTDAVMLSGETAAGRHPVEAVSAMRAIAVEAEGHLLAGQSAYVSAARDTHASTLHDALALGTERMARSLAIRAIVVVTRSGETARYMASARPRVPILALAPDSGALGRSTLYWGVHPLPCRPPRSPSDVLRLSEAAVLDRRVAKPGDTILVAVGREGSEEYSGRVHIHRVGGASAARRGNGQLLSRGTSM